MRWRQQGQQRLRFLEEGDQTRHTPRSLAIIGALLLGLSALAALVVTVAGYIEMASTVVDWRLETLGTDITQSVVPLVGLAALTGGLGLAAYRLLAFSTGGRIRPPSPRRVERDRANPSSADTCAACGARTREAEGPRHKRVRRCCRCGALASPLRRALCRVGLLVAVPMAAAGLGQILVLLVVDPAMVWPYPYCVTGSGPGLAERLGALLALHVIPIALFVFLSYRMNVYAFGCLCPPGRRFRIAFCTLLWVGAAVSLARTIYYLGERAHWASYSAPDRPWSVTLNALALAIAGLLSGLLAYWTSRNLRKRTAATGDSRPSARMAPTDMEE